MQEQTFLYMAYLGIGLLVIELLALSGLLLFKIIVTFNRNLKIQYENKITNLLIIIFIDILSTISICWMIAYLFGDNNMEYINRYEIRMTIFKLIVLIQIISTFYLSFYAIKTWLDIRNKKSNKLKINKVNLAIFIIVINPILTALMYQSVEEKQHQILNYLYENSKDGKYLDIDKELEHLKANHHNIYGQFEYKEKSYSKYNQ